MIPMTALSVIIPTFQRNELTHCAIRSVLSQNARCEIIVVDDGSDPEFVPATDIVSSIRLLRHENNQGAAAARNTGIEAANGDFLTFLDSDDQLLPDTLASRLDFAKADGGRNRIYGCAWEERGNNGHKRMRVPMAAFNQTDYFGGCWFAPGSAVIFPRDVFNTTGLFDARYRRLEDVDWTIRFALIGGKYKCQPECGVLVRHHPHKERDAILCAASMLKNDLDKKTANGEVSKRAKRRFHAYLHLEIAAVKRRERQGAAFLWHMTRSMLLYPRFRIHTSPGWKTHIA